MKKYLKTIEDVEALRNTDTKIYREYHTGYFKFVNGVLCFFNTDSAYIFYNVTMDFNQVESKLYIEVEDEPSEDDIGKLGWFYNGIQEDGHVSILVEMEDFANCKYKSNYGSWHRFFQPLTPEEVEKYTGYKVVREK